MAQARKSARTRVRAQKAGRARGKQTTAQAPGIQAWQDDPLGLPAIARPTPRLTQAPLKFKIKGAAVRPGVYTPGTREFRYWTAAEAVRRGGDFWASLGIRRWQSSVGSSLPLGLDEGVDLNAYYDRNQLAFFHDTVKGTSVYSCESPDVVCHELGHACLDAHRPQLWDAPYIEVGSFHESFGDQSAILSALQLPSVRAAALSGIKNDKPSVLSRCAEQLGWAIRQISRTAVDSDCLRNAWNRFTYVDPNTLPDSAPATRLCAEVHSFSRVFTGTFYEILSAMLAIISGSPTDDDLVTVATDYASLLTDAVATAPVSPNFYAQVAARMIDADASRFQGKYRQALAKAFAGRKILPDHLVNQVTKVPKQVRNAAAAFALKSTIHSQTHKIVLSAKAFGFPKGPLVVPAPLESPEPLAAGMAELRSSDMRRSDAERAAQRFVEMLVAHDRVDVTAKSKSGVASARSLESDRRVRLHTHCLVKVKEGLQLQRVRFLCGHPRWR
jgi:hypothetical protein